jgi:hypothetical protein
MDDQSWQVNPWQARLRRAPQPWRSTAGYARLGVTGNGKRRWPWHGRHGRHGCMWLITAGKVWRLMACRERHGRQRVVGIEPGSMRIGNSRQDWHGWQGNHRHASAGMGRMALQLLAWQAWQWPVLIGHWLARYGRSRKVWFFFQWRRHGRNGQERMAYRPGSRSGRQRSDGQGFHGSQWQGRRGSTRSTSLGLFANGTAGKASHADAGRLSHGRQRKLVWIGLESGKAGMALNGWPRHCRRRSSASLALFLARQAAQCSSRSGNAWHGSATKRSTGSTLSRQAPHDTERLGTEGRQGLASLEGKQRQARPRWSANAWKERQALLLAKRQHNGALRGPFHPRENHDHFSIPRRPDPH